MLEKNVNGKRKKMNSTYTVFKNSNRLSPIFCIGKQHKMLIFAIYFILLIYLYPCEN